MNAITTPRLVLTPLERGDLRELHALYSDPELMRWITGRARTPRETGLRLRKDVRHHREHGFGLCLGREREGGGVVGRFGVEPVVTERGLEGELAWMVATPFQRRGFATEATEAFVDHALRELELVRLFAVCHPENEASLRVMARLGLVEVEATHERRVFEHPGGR